MKRLLIVLALTLFLGIIGRAESRPPPGPRYRTWIVAYEYATDIHLRYNGRQQDPVERMDCLNAAWMGAGIIWDGSPDLFRDRDDVFLFWVAVAGQESGFNPEATNGQDFGLYQINKTNLKPWGVTDWRDPWQSSQAGAQYMAYLLDYIGDVKWAVVGYNAGPAAGKNRKMPASGRTAVYVKMVMEDFEMMREAAR